MSRVSKVTYVHGFLCMLILSFVTTVSAQPPMSAELPTENLITTASGLQYTILKEGRGAYPKATDTVTVHYRGTLLDGREFDSSYSRGEPTSFPLTGVIKGWTEGLQLVKPGGKIKLVIPANLAYGSRSIGIITPYSTLVFEIELLSIGAK